VLAYDYEGYGLSDGTPTIRNACRDGLVAYDYAVKACGFAPKKVLVYGSSLGCGVAGYIATRRTIGGLVLHAGFSSLRLVATEMLPITRFVPDLLFFRPRMDNVAALKSLSPDVPLRVVHGEWDEMFGLHHPRAVFEAAAATDKKLTVIKGGSHMTRDAGHQQALQEVVDLLR
jgi:pimeloyl-ACP methyl ester carboxylesterase